MKEKITKCLIFCILLSISFSGFGQAGGCDLKSEQDGDWSNNSTWDGNSPSCTVNQDICIEPGDTVFSSCNNLEISGNNSITIKDGARLVLDSNSNLTGNGDLTVEDGGSLYVGGNLDISGNGDFQNDGDVYVEDSLIVDGSGKADGSGTIGIGKCCCSNWDGDQSNCNGALPVELIKFEGNNHSGGVFLIWKTASEQENEKFLIERSEDGENFQQVGIVPGAGTSVIPNEYHFEDMEAPSGKPLYYRLIQVDRDGERTSYGPIFVVNEGLAKSGLKIQPNPIRNRSELVFPNETSGDLTLTIYDISGRAILSQKVSGDAGNFSIQKDEMGLKSGTYILNVREGSGRSYRKKMLVR